MTFSLFFPVVLFFSGGHYYLLPLEIFVLAWRLSFPFYTIYTVFFRFFGTLPFPVDSFFFFFFWKHHLLPPGICAVYVLSLFFSLCSSQWFEPRLLFVFFGAFILAWLLFPLFSCRHSFLGAGATLIFSPRNFLLCSYYRSAVRFIPGTYVRGSCIQQYNIVLQRQLSLPRLHASVLDVVDACRDRHFITSPTTF